MALHHVGLKEINGSLIVLDDVENAGFDELVEIHLKNNNKRKGRIVQIYVKRVVIQVFECKNDI